MPANNISFSTHAISLTVFILLLSDQRQNSFTEDYNNRNGYPQKHFGERSQTYNSNGKWYNEKRQNRRSEESRGYREQSTGHGSTNNNKPPRGENNHEREINSVDRDSNSSAEVNNSRRRPKARSNATNHTSKHYNNSCG